MAAALSGGGAQSPKNAVAAMAPPSPTEPIKPPMTSTKYAEQQQHQQQQQQRQCQEVQNTGAVISRDLTFLNRAVLNRPAHRTLVCAAEEVEDVKVVVKILPIFASTVMLSCCLAQLSTFSVEQAATMDTRACRGLHVPPASLPVFPVTFIMLLAPIYDHVVVPFARRVTKTEMGISHLQRIGAGLVLSTVAMAVAALVEVRRLNAAILQR